jgi:hypothetical protein
MIAIASFAAAASPWQNFYILTGTAAATLVGLMFVAVTFGASLVTPETPPNTDSARAFLDPTFNHFVQVLLTACLIQIPTLSATLLGVVLLLLSALRTTSLFWVYRRLVESHRLHGDMELLDWLSGVVFPLLAYLLLGATGAGFLAGYARAFDGLAIVTIAMLLIGVYGAWELLVWLAFARIRPHSASGGK